MSEIFKTVKPEEVGVKSQNVKKFYEKVEEIGLTEHGVLMMRGDKIFSEAYWQPFHKDFCHRMYSETKSFVGIAIGLLVEDGLVNLDDKICDYFRDKIDGPIHEYLENQTIRQMLTMTTSVRCEGHFLSKDKDRTHLYLNSKRIVRPAGTTWEYDSAGSQVLCSLVERLTGKKLLDYMKERIFNHIGSFKTAEVLMVPTGESWGDSAMVCTLRDIASFGRFLLNYGTWNGKRLMNEEYIREATSPLVDNSLSGHTSKYHTHGYGYQIWRVGEDSFGFIGMGCQLTICNPKKDIIFACNSDNIGASYGYDAIIELFNTYIIDTVIDEELPSDEDAYADLVNYCSNLKLRSLKGEKYNPLVEKINGKVYKPIETNPQGITEFSLSFNEDGSGTFDYVNAQGKKQICFKYGDNAFGKFPQYGYSNEYSSIPAGGDFMYKCATSGAWRPGNKFMLYVQIIDKYFGNLTISFFYKDDIVNVVMDKNAEYFLGEYLGEFTAKAE